MLPSDAKFDLFVEELGELDELSVDRLPDGMSPAATIGSAASFGSFSTFGGCWGTFSSAGTASTFS
jgi:hypothetical protein